VIPATNYIVAATPRTGSGLLCYGLEDTGIAGRPAEFFAPHLRSQWCQSWLLSENVGFRQYHEAALRHGTTNNGFFGLKIHWMHVVSLAQDALQADDSDLVLESLFPRAKFVSIVRRDRRAQALSYFRALLTNEWERFGSADNQQTVGRVITLKPDAILALETDLCEQQQAWEQYFCRNGINPLVVQYEALATDYRGQVARVLNFLGLDERAAQTVPRPRLIRQSDETTLRWRLLMEDGFEQEARNREIAP